MKISIVVPVFNEQPNIMPLAGEIEETITRARLEAEVIWTDDGSTDGSFEELKKLCAKNTLHRAIRLGRNFGQTAAISAGISAAKGDVIALLDADGQNNPADIPAMLSKLEEGYDVVSGWRKNRQDDWATRTLPSKIANALISKVTGISLHDYGCTLKLYRRRYITSFKVYGEMHRFLAALAGLQGARIAEVVVSHRPRLKGHSKYGLMRTFKVLLDLATVKFMGAYMSKPIYLFGGTGIALGAVSFFCAGYTLYNKLFNHVFVKDQPLFLVAIFLAIVGVQLLLLGILSEVLIRVYYEINNRPPYFIKETAGMEEK